MHDLPANLADPADRRATTCSYICAVWAHQAERKFGFDTITSRRLAFVRWLYAVGRLE